MQRIIVRGLHATLPTLSALGLLCASSLPLQVHAQPSASDSRDTPAPIEQKAERITHEDAGSRIEELRVGGQTRHIEVQSNTALPPYRVQPIDANRPVDNHGAGTNGQSSWRILKF